MFGFVSKFKKEVVDAFATVHARLTAVENALKTKVEEPAPVVADVEKVAEDTKQEATTAVDHAV